MRRLRREPAVLLPYVPDPDHVLATVRLFHPGAERLGDTIRAGAGIVLRSPFPGAYVCSHPELLPGLAHRLGGRLTGLRSCWDTGASVYLPVRPDPAELAAVLRPYACPVEEAGRLKEFEEVELFDGIAYTGREGVDAYAGARIAGLLRVCGHRPYALGLLRGEPDLLVCDLSEAVAEDRCGTRLALDIGQAAMDIATVYGGMALDSGSYRLTRAADLLWQQARTPAG